MCDVFCSFQFLIALNHEPGIIYNHVNVANHNFGDVTKAGSDPGKPIFGEESRNVIIITTGEIEQAVGNVLFDCDKPAPSRQSYQSNASQTKSQQQIRFRIIDRHNVDQCVNESCEDDIVSVQNIDGTNS